jgi:hypothetical protein
MFEIFAIIVNTMLTEQGSELFSETLILLMRTSQMTRKIILEASEPSEFSKTLNFKGSIWEYWLWFSYLRRDVFNLQIRSSENEFTREILFDLGMGHRLQQTFVLKVCDSGIIDPHLSDDLIDAWIVKRKTLPKRICACVNILLVDACKNDLDYFKRCENLISKNLANAILNWTDNQEIFEHALNLMLGKKLSLNTLIGYNPMLIERFKGSPSKLTMLININNKLKQQS